MVVVIMSPGVEVVLLPVMVTWRSALTEKSARVLFSCCSSGFIEIIANSKSASPKRLSSKNLCRCFCAPEFIVFFVIK